MSKNSTTSQKSPPDFSELIVLSDQQSHLMETIIDLAGEREIEQKSPRLFALIGLALDMQSKIEGIVKKMDDEAA